MVVFTDMQLNPDNIKVLNTTYSSYNFENIFLHVSLNITYTKYVIIIEREEIVSVTSYVFPYYVFN
jgi:hypothetical protein